MTWMPRSREMRRTNMVQSRFGRSIAGVAAALTLLAFGCVLSAEARAGGGPETTLLVVNSASPGSQTIANYYQSIRNIPATNVVYVDWGGSTARTDINTFRDKILVPVFKAVDAHDQIGAPIDCITYSSDFPWAI